MLVTVKLSSQNFILKESYVIITYNSQVLKTKIKNE